MTSKETLLGKIESTRAKFLGCATKVQLQALVARSDNFPTRWKNLLDRINRKKKRFYFLICVLYIKKCLLFFPFFCFFLESKEKKKRNRNINIGRFANLCRRNRETK